MIQRITWTIVLGIIFLENLISVTRNFVFGITFAIISGRSVCVLCLWLFFCPQDWFCQRKTSVEVIDIKPQRVHGVRWPCHMKGACNSTFAAGRVRSKQREISLKSLVPRFCENARASVANRQAIQAQLRLHVAFPRTFFTKNSSV